MFYCESCREERKWPYSLHKSVGKCELCGCDGQQYDVDSQHLPDRNGNIPEYVPMCVVYPNNAWDDIKIKK